MLAWCRLSPWHVLTCQHHGDAVHCYKGCPCRGIVRVADLPSCMCQLPPIECKACSARWQHKVVSNHFTSSVMGSMQYELGALYACQMGSMQYELGAL